MKVKRLIPIINVSDIKESFVWFEKIGWTKGWDWGEPPTFGGVYSGECEIFLCQNGQGSRGGPVPQHVPDDDDRGGVWMSWFLSSPAEVDEVYRLALAQGVVVARPPTNELWGVRECQILHPDGHTFRVSAELEEE
jgi:catechol 2,3-dioxygenase-like lactoylglutathione lyase family enzyme